MNNEEDKLLQHKRFLVKEIEELKEDLTNVEDKLYHIQRKSGFDGESQ